MALASMPALAAGSGAKCMATTIGERHYRLELATTPKAREHGLMERDSIGACDGMAFFFPVVAVQKFWMKNTRIPLDMLFIDANGKIVSIVTAKPHSLTPQGPDIPVSTVIEIDGGRAERDGVSVGDRVTYAHKKPSHSAAH